MWRWTALGGRLRDRRFQSAGAKLAPGSATPTLMPFAVAVDSAGNV